MGISTVFKQQQIDLYLTNMMIGFGNGNYVGKNLFPLVEVDQESFFWNRFDDDGVTLFSDARRLPGEQIKRFSSDFSTQKADVYQNAIEYELPHEFIRTSRMSGVQLDERAGRRSRATIDLIMEYDLLQLASNPLNYPVTNRITLNAASQVNNPTADVEQMFETAKAAIFDQVGEYPNVCIMSYNVLQQLRKHPRTKESFLNFANNNSPLVQLEGVAARYGLGKLYVASAAFRPAGAPLTQARTKMFNNSILMAYVPSVADNVDDRIAGTGGGEVVPNPNHNSAMPSYGYNFGLSGEVMVALEPYEEKNRRTYYYPTVSRYRPVITSATSGYLISNASGV